MCDKLFLFWHIVIDQELSIVVVPLPVLCSTWVCLGIRTLNCPVDVLNAIVHLKHVAHGGRLRDPIVLFTIQPRRDPLDTNIGNLLHSRHYYWLVLHYH